MSINKLPGIFLLFAVIMPVGCGDDDSADMDPDNDMNDDDNGGLSGTVWTGDLITFTKEDGADPTQEANQDRITDNVWITRGDEKLIYNAVTQTEANNTGPDDTEWAEGTTANVSSLSFSDFRDLGKPPTLVDKDLVLHLITDDIYIDIKFTSWAKGKEGGEGGFSYDRSTAPE